ncbi:MAG: c-type cytochrome [Hyphomonas sp.]|nr:c-type cytochrome [Hyphomonas sp.]
MKPIWMAALIGAAGIAACAQAAPYARTEQLVARGEYLVTGIGGCNDCHTPMTAAGPDMSRTLQGGELIFGPMIDMPWAPYAPPLAGGLTAYSDAEFAALLQTGLRPDGSTPRPPMPPFRLSAADAEAVVAYIKTLPPAP